MTTTLQQLQSAAGATLATIDDQTVPASFGNDAEAWTAAQSGVAIADRSHWGRIAVGDSDRIRFLHNQSTHDFQSLKPGSGCETVFVTSTARTLDLVTAYVTDETVLLITAPGHHQSLIEFMDRYIFFADKVTLTDRTGDTALFSLMGPQSEELLKSLGVTLTSNATHTHETVDVDGISVRVAVGNGLELPGYNLIVAADQAADLWQRFVNAGAVPMGDQVWQQLRIVQGRPLPGHELTEDYNPLEAGLWHTLSFEKGCYIGQETIARLNTYRGVKLQLWGIELSAIAPAQSPIWHDNQKVGVLTSVAETPDGIRGLAYIRTKAGGAGLTVHVGETAESESAIAGTVIDVPYLSHGYLNPT